MKESFSVSSALEEAAGLQASSSMLLYDSGFSSGFVVDYGEFLGPVTTEEIAALKRTYASLLIQLDRLRSVLVSADVLFRPTDGAWSIKEILGHMVDTDKEIWWPRIMAVLNQDHPRFTTIDQKELVRRHHWQSIPIEDIFAQLMRVRWDHAMQLNGMSDEFFERTGDHETLGEMSILGILQLLIAHDAHYMNRIRTLVEETSAATVH